MHSKPDSERRQHQQHGHADKRQRDHGRALFFVVGRALISTRPSVIARRRFQPDAAPAAA